MNTHSFKTRLVYVLRKGRDLAAIEVKSGWRKIQASGLEHFSRRYKCLKVLVGGSGIPIKEALKMEAEAFLKGDLKGCIEHPDMAGNRLKNFRK